MFKFLKKKLKDAVGKFSKKVEDEVEEKVEEVIEEPISEKEKIEEKEPKVEEKVEIQEEVVEKKIEEKEKKKEPEIKEVVKEEPVVEEKKIEKIEKPEIKVEKPKKEYKEEVKREVTEFKEETKVKEEPEPVKEKKGFFKRIKEKVVKTQLSEEKFNDLFWNLEIVLMENNVAVEVIDKIKEDLKKNLCEERIGRLGVEKIIKDTLRDSINELFDVEKIDLIEKIKQKKEKPFVIVFVGINGVGKTTSLAKVANKLKKQGLSCVMAAGDTFRVAAIEQLEEHAKRLDIKIIKQEYGSDSAAVCFDAVAHAKSKGIDVVLIDTAGRQHSNANLMDELRKVVKVSKPDLTLFVGDSLTGNDAVEQAKEFNEHIGIDGIILSKADVDDKGGSAISISYVTNKPIIYFGVGQTYDDLQEFSPAIILDNLGLEA
ncbi:signal recognition particle-docking protein FtsY [Candidatus Woesearchaeota archaeon]|nr:signal recognition particle-docking protein FtsY [Candidatus Woesearchaeota archaeon]